MVLTQKRGTPLDLDLDVNLALDLARAARLCYAELIGASGASRSMRLGDHATGRPWRSRRLGRRNLEVLADSVFLNSES